MAGYNRIVLVGNLTRDPEYKQLGSGQAVCRLGLAINRQFKNRQTGSMVQEVCYIDIDVWGPQAESCNQYLQKGREVLIEGRLKLDSWEDAQGQKRSKHSVVADRVVFLAGGGASEGADTVSQSAGRVQGARAGSSELPEPQNEVERELFSQIDEIKSRKKATVAQSKKEEAKSKTEVDFVDAPPFEDELPF